jgi:ACS family hexuronate transporter-like MFS transporter
METAVPKMVEKNIHSQAPSTLAHEPEASFRVWCICVLMLLATMINYMDRLALSQQATRICAELNFDNTDYSRIEKGFGIAFAVGGIVTGLAADRISPRWLYPTVLLGWSSVGFATGWVTSYTELLTCRVLLGFFEAGQWPCALVTAQRLLSRRDRALGNSIIQSGASVGAIATPVVVLFLATNSPGGWRLPFRVIGAAGLGWVIAWLLTVRSRDLRLDSTTAPALAPDRTALPIGGQADCTNQCNSGWLMFCRRFLALVVVVIVINLCWQFFRAWMPKMLQEQYHYTSDTVQYFSIAYYIAADVGCLAIGFLTKWLAGRGVVVHQARMLTFLACAGLTALTTVAAALPASTLFLAILLLIAFGSLGLFPSYYAFTQELSARRMGNVTGLLSFMTWMAHAIVQEPIGGWIDRTGLFSRVMLVAGLVPWIGVLAMLTLWNVPARRAARHAARDIG